jgi:DNA processing protein
VTGVPADDRTALVALAHCGEPGDVALGRLVSERGAVAVARAVSEGGAELPHAEGLSARLAASQWCDADAKAAARDARIITRVDREWPLQLDDLGVAAPFALWVQGAAHLRFVALRSVSIVGARACTAYGEEVARTWSAALAGEQWSVVSGGAYGIDAAVHRGALAVDGVTVCILAGGIDVPYPRAHDALIARIADDGLVISESPLGQQVRRQRFLSRNRLIAALSRATVVVEAAERSGTIATARAAAATGRPVMAVPGPVSSAASAGCHRMIRDGDALLVRSPDEVMDLLDLDRLAARSADDAARPTLTDSERRILDALPARGGRTVGQLCVATGLDVGEILAGIGVLAGRSYLESADDGWRLTRRSDRALRSSP